MELDQQLKTLIDEAPQYGVPSTVMEKGITPVLKLLASQLQHLNYYILQTRDQSWVLTTLTQREKPQHQKKVIYAFPSRKDATSFQGIWDEKIITKSIPVTHLLFQLFALKQVDSIIFMETPGNLDTGKEIQRVEVENIIMQQLRRLNIPSSGPKSVPPNFA